VSITAKVLLGLIRLYQVTLSSVMGRQCRFHPSCSVYTAEAIRRFGAGRGTLVGLARICRCNPFGRGGHDPVPDGWKKAFCCDKTADVQEPPPP
jgi:putative membrane protein insertion efficiency factor